MEEQLLEDAMQAMIAGEQQEEEIFLGEILALVQKLLG